MRLKKFKDYVVNIFRKLHIYETFCKHILKQWNVYTVHVKLL